MTAEDSVDPQAGSDGNGKNGKDTKDKEKKEGSVEKKKRGEKKTMLVMSGGEGYIDFRIGKSGYAP